MLVTMLHTYTHTHTQAAVWNTSVHALHHHDNWLRIQLTDIGERFFDRLTEPARFLEVRKQTDQCSIVRNWTATIDNEQISFAVQNIILEVISAENFPCRFDIFQPACFFGGHKSESWPMSSKGHNHHRTGDQTTFNIHLTSSQKIQIGLYIYTNR